MEFKFLEEREIQELQARKPKEAINRLFAYRFRLLDAARDNEMIRQEIFRQRKIIANIFRQYGNEPLQEMITLLETLQHPEDLLAYTRPSTKTTTDEEMERRLHRPGYYVLGAEFDSFQEKAIRQANKSNKRVGNQIPIEFVHLLRSQPITGKFQETRVFQDNRPIYINLAHTKQIQKLLGIATYLQPELISRLIWIQWQDNIPHMIRYDSAKPQSLNAEEEILAAQLERYLNYVPKNGDIFTGTIVTASSFGGVFVEILPGIEGMLHAHYNPYISMESLRPGDKIKVKILAIDEHHGRIQLIIVEEGETEDQNQAPVFDFSIPKFLE